MTSACRTASRPARVMRPGSPGPAPTRYTMPAKVGDARFALLTTPPPGWRTPPGRGAPPPAARPAPRRLRPSPRSRRAAAVLRPGRRPGRAGAGEGHRFRPGRRWRGERRGGGAPRRPERALTHGREHRLRRQYLGGAVQPAQAGQAGGGEDGGVVVAVLHLADAGVDVAADIGDAEVGGLWCARRGGASPTPPTTPPPPPISASDSCDRSPLVVTVRSWKRTPGWARRRASRASSVCRRARRLPRLPATNAGRATTSASSARAAAGLGQVPA